METGQYLNERYEAMEDRLAVSGRTTRIFNFTALGAVYHLVPYYVISNGQ